MPSPQVTPSLIFAIAIATIGSFQFGYNTGVINAPEAIIKDFLNYTLEERLEDLPSTGLLTSLWSLSVAIFSVGGMIGSFSVGLFVNRFGRRNSMLFVNLLAIAGGSFMGFCKLAESFEMLILGRLIIGLFCGLCTGFVPMYIGEISPTALRGAFGTLNQLGIVIGILIAQIFGLEVILGSEELWPVLLGFTIIPAVLQSVALPFCPESPRFLLINRKEEEKAKEIKSQVESFLMTLESNFQPLKNKSYRFSSMIIFYVLSLFSRTLQSKISLGGVVVESPHPAHPLRPVFYYSTGIFKDAGVQEPIYATIGAGVVNTIFTVVSVRLYRPASKVLLSESTTGQSVCAVCSVLISESSFLLQNNYSWMSFVCIGAILVFVAFFEIGPGPIPWFIVAELFSQGPRPAAVAVAGCSNWTSNFLVGLLFPSAAAYLGAYVFIIFSTFLIIFLVFTFFKVPETRGRTFEDITRAFEGQAADSSGKGSNMEMNSMRPFKQSTTPV
uniref:Solute carrier family 2, facilitated glucose transporter member 3 n=1 Tax=Otolemur garnettii TaxID=30611 RepID=H0X828_OTOGA